MTPVSEEPLVRSGSITATDEMKLEEMKSSEKGDSSAGLPTPTQPDPAPKKLGSILTGSSSFLEQWQLKFEELSTCDILGSGAFGSVIRFFVFCSLI